ncbi:MAG: hypothetical protein GY719_37545 [bacterium]|nr:hypothetical protein [bacterium]
MAEHIWSVLCYKGVEDKSTNQISLLEVIEKVVLQADFLESALRNAPEGAKRLLMPLQVQLVSWWRRSDRDQVEEPTRARLAIIDVDGEEFSNNEMALPMDEHHRYRTIVKIPAMPIDRGSGTMWFTVSLQDGEEWAVVASLPLEVEISNPAPPAET